MKELKNNNSKHKKNLKKEKTIINEKSRREKRIEKIDEDIELVIDMTNRNNQIKKQQKNDRNMKIKLKKEKKKKRLKLIIKCTSIIILMIIISIIAFTSPIFNIKNIEVIGNNQVPQDTIISLSKISTGENIFKFSKTDVQKSIKENPYVENIEVSRKFPNKVQIKIQEREKRFSMAFLNRYAYIDTQGYILEISENSLDLPIIQGLSTNEENIIAGNRLENEDLQKLENIIQIQEVCISNNLEDKVKTIDISEKNEYSIYLEEEKKIVHLGDATNLTNKMLYVLSILEDTKGKEGEIFVNGDLNNKFLPYFREKV